LDADAAGEFIKVKVSEVGFTDQSGSEGLLWLKADDGKAFAMRSFSGESAMHMQRFSHGDRSSIPSVYNMVEEIADKEGLHLSGIKVYPVGEVLRADLQLLGRGKDMSLAGYRASDAIALALLYDAPIMLHRSLLEFEQQEDSRH
jgi:bifunctional DNase/RNase